jgi:acyl CoA:acetate/3-ketoacid CoA transferase beta subunit
MTRAEAFSEREVAMCTVAKIVEDGRTYWAAGGGTPLYSILLGKQLYAPELQYVTEDGVIAPEPLLPYEPMMTMIASRATRRALSWGTMNTAGIHAQLGYMDYGVLNTLQVDQHGNINSTIIGEYGPNTRRFGGPGGADTIAACCWRTILITDQEKRKFVRQVDFISSPGYLDGTAGARERAGLPKDTGPWRVVTPWAMYDFLDRRLRLIGRVPWVTVEEILAECEWKPLIADDVAVLEAPTEEEVLLLRTELDVRGQTTDAAGAWITWDGEKYVRAGQG